MELIYLWVENYKNIHKQGFNFSPRFECTFHDEYDENGKLKNNCKLEICDKKKKECKDNDYIEKFFGENINVTAIVGKNGSGKSSLFESIMQYIYVSIKELNYLKVYSTRYNQHNQWYGHLKYIFIFKYGNALFIYEHISNFSYPYLVKKISNSKLILKSKEDMINFNFEKKMFFLHYDESFDGINSMHIFGSSKMPYQKKEITDKFSRANPNKKNFQFLPKRGDFFINKNDEKFMFINYLLNKKKQKNKKFDKYFEPEKIELVCTYTMGEIPHHLKEIAKTLDSTMDSIKMMFYIFLYLALSKEFNFDTTIKFEKFNEFENYIDRFDFLKEKNGRIFSYLNKLDRYSSDIDKIFTLEKMGKDSYITNLHIDIEFLKNKRSEELLTLIPIDYFDIHIFGKKEKFYENLSTGEKSMLRIRIYIENFISTIEEKRNIFYILLDEPANAMHPKWQKELLNYLIDSFKDRKEKFHFILTTHSPFLLSDIPKQNIIFLDKDENTGNCIVLKDGLKEKKQTFGANIHTLLSDSFFMEDGLMGEFAKGKINEIKRFYDVFIKYQKNKKINKAYKCIYLKKRKKFWQIQSIIGEPFLKTVIKNYLDEIETILFQDKAKEIAIERFIKEFGEDAIIEVMNNDKN